MQPDMDLQAPGDGWDYDYVDDDAAGLEAHQPLPTPLGDGIGGQGWVQLILGTLFVAAAVVVALPPDLVAPAAGVVEALRGIGLETGVLGLAGLIFLSLGSVQRSIRRAALAGANQAISAGGSELLLATDQIVTDLEQVLTAVLRTNDDISAVSDAQRLLIKELLEEKEPSEKEHNALYRLAASLDSLNARVDTRLHEFDVQFRSRFESVSAAVHDARLALETRVEALLPSAPARPARSAGAGASADPSLEFFERIEEQPLPHAMAAEEPDAALPTKLEMEALDALLPDDDPSQG